MPLQINKTGGHLTSREEACLTDSVCCTGELLGTKASLCMEPAWDTSVFIRLIEHKSTSRALNKNKECSSSMQAKWHIRHSWMLLTCPWQLQKTFSFHSNTLLSLTWLPANSSHLQKNIQRSWVLTCPDLALTNGSSAFCSSKSTSFILPPWMYSSSLSLFKCVKKTRSQAF